MKYCLDKAHFLCKLLTLPAPPSPQPPLPSYLLCVPVAPGTPVDAPCPVHPSPGPHARFSTPLTLSLKSSALRNGSQMPKPRLGGPLFCSDLCHHGVCLHYTLCLEPATPLHTETLGGSDLCIPSSEHRAQCRMGLQEILLNEWFPPLIDGETDIQGGEGFC